VADDVLTEEPLQFGDRERLFGTLTPASMQSRVARELPVFVFERGSAAPGRSDRLHVRLGRELAQIGFSSLRVDLAGRVTAHHARA
jgi:hypothetical protein